jgi:hypothetical protein
MADFVLGRLKFKWRGDWAASTAYLIDDIVKYGGNTYVVLTNHTSQASAANFYTDLSASKYSLHSESLFFKGDWAGSTFYRLNDLVKNGAFQYRCKLQHTSASTFAIGSNWQVFTEGLQFEDSYGSSTTYQDGDVVTYGGYTYVYINATPAAGQTPTDNAYWDVVTTGYKQTGDYDFSVNYKTGDVVKYGGNSYVSKTNHLQQYPSNTNGTVNTSHWDLIVAGFNYRAAYSASTTYKIGDVVRLTTTTYLAIQDRILNVSPDSDAAKWQVIAQGDSGAVLSTRGDLLKQGGSQTERLPIGTVGAVLTTDGSDPIWSNAEGKNVYYVANSGSDSNPGTEYLPFKTVYYALSQASSGDVVDFNTITGGTGGVPGTYDITQTSSDGSGTGAKARVVLDGSSTPTVVITDGGSGHAAGDVITFADGGSDQLGTASDMTITVVSASVGDVIYVKNGVYRETLPIRVPAGVTVQGESLRGTEIRPNTGTGHQVKTVSVTSGGTGGTPGTYNYVHANATSGSGVAASFVANVVCDGSSTPTVTIYHGGTGFVVGNTITIPGSSLGSSSNLVLTVASLENNDASDMFLLNNQTNIVQMSMKGLTGAPTGKVTGKAAVVSLDPSGSITTASPYIQNCSSVNAGATGIEIDGNLHSAGNKSILANDFTQINSDGRGVHALARGRGEMVSIFTYYCDKSFYCTTGGFIRGLNCSSGYGEYGAVADGTDPNETPVGVQTRGEILKYNTTTFVGAATESDIGDMINVSGSPTAGATITGVTSGATAVVFRVNISLDYIHIENRSGNFQQGEVVTIQKEDSSTFQVSLDSSTGDSSAAQIGQIGPLIAVSSGTTNLSSAGLIKVGTNLKFTGDSKYYRISLVSEENTTNQTALIRITESITTANAKADNTVADVTQNFSNVRLTGHDFLDIGTGGFADTNYPGASGQAASQEDEVDELNGGRVYFVSSDQKGDFRVGDLFRIEQATGIATLNADAFDLSGLTELQLGSIGAELGATINEFSTDVTLSGDANTAVPTERAVKRHLTTDSMGTGHLVPPTGTTSERPTGGDLFTGGIRYNSSLVTWEGYNGTQWTGLGGGNPWASTASDITVAANDRYFVDTSGGAKTITLPASPQVGDQVSLLDLASTFDTNNLTVARNSLKINGATADLVVDVEDSAIQLVYTGATYGWKLTSNN